MAVRRVLIVDDDGSFLNMLTEMLKGCGYDVSPASRPREALHILKNHPPFDLVLSDVVMPEMRGTDLVCEIADLAPETACVLMTAGSFDATQLPPGVQLLRKPFSRNDLIAAIEQALHGPQK